MLEHSYDYSGMQFNLICKSSDLRFRARSFCFEFRKSLLTNENVFCPTVCFIFKAISSAVLVVNKVLAAMKNNVRRLVKKDPPEMIVSFQPKGHLDYCTVRIEPSRRS